MIHGTRTSPVADPERELLVACIAIVFGALIGIAGFLALTLGLMS